MMNTRKQLLERLNKIDIKSIDENDNFYDLRSLYESIEHKLSAQDKIELKQLVDVTEDPDMINTFIDKKVHPDNYTESYDEYDYELDSYLDEDYVDNKSELNSICDKLYDSFNEKNIHVEDLGVIDSDSIMFSISWGDWKHEHLRADWVARELLDSLGYKNKYKISTNVTEDDGSDTYSADHYIDFYDLPLEEAYSNSFQEDVFNALSKVAENHSRDRLSENDFDEACDYFIDKYYNHTYTESFNSSSHTFNAAELAKLPEDDVKELLLNAEPDSRITGVYDNFWLKKQLSEDKPPIEAIIRKNGAYKQNYYAPVRTMNYDEDWSVSGSTKHIYELLNIIYGKNKYYSIFDHTPTLVDIQGK